MEKYFLRHLYNLPDYYTEAETNRLSIVYFCLAGLDALNALHLLDKLWIINHIYYHQVTSGGFTGSRHLGTQPGEDSLEQGNLAMTFAAITSLLILGDDLTRLNKEDLFRGEQSLNFYSLIGSSWRFIALYALPQVLKICSEVMVLSWEAHLDVSLTFVSCTAHARYRLF